MTQKCYHVFCVPTGVHFFDTRDRHYRWIFVGVHVFKQGAIVAATGLHSIRRAGEPICPDWADMQRSSRLPAYVPMTPFLNVQRDNPKKPLVLLNLLQITFSPN